LHKSQTKRRNAKVVHSTFANLDFKIIHESNIYIMGVAPTSFWPCGYATNASASKAWSDMPISPPAGCR